MSPLNIFRLYVPYGGLDVGEHPFLAPLMRVLGSALNVFYQKMLSLWAFCGLSDTNR